MCVWELGRFSMSLCVCVCIIFNSGWGCTRMLVGVEWKDVLVSVYLYVLCS